MNIQRHVDKGPFATDPFPYLVKYSIAILKKKTKVLDILKYGKNVNET